MGLDCRVAEHMHCGSLGHAGPLSSSRPRLEIESFCHSWKGVAPPGRAECLCTSALGHILLVRKAFCALQESFFEMFARVEAEGELSRVLESPLNPVCICDIEKA